MITLIRHSFFWKVFVGYAALVAVSTAVIAGILLGAWRRETLRTLDSTLLGTARLIAAMEAANPDHLWSTSLPQHILEVSEQTGLILTIVFANGEVAASSAPLGEPESGASLLILPEFIAARDTGRGEASRALHHQGDLHRLLVTPIVLDYEIIGYVRAGLPLAQVENQLAALRGRVLTGAVLNALLALGLGFGFARHTTRPLVSIRDACQRIAEGDFARRITLQRRDEIGVVATTINRMLDDVERRIRGEIRERQRLSTLLAGMSDGVVAVTAKGVIAYHNEVATRLLGFESTRAEGKTVESQLTLRPALELYRQAIKGTQRVIRELRVHGHPSDLVLRVAATPLRDEANAPFGVLLVLHDLSELRRLEELRRTFTANVSHELKTPLTAIGALLDILQGAEPVEAPTQRRFLQKIRLQSERLVALVSELLVLSQLESDPNPPVMQSVDASALVQGCIQTFSEVAERKGVDLGATSGANSLPLRSHEESLRLILHNLIHNAITHTPAGGRVTVSASATAESATFIVSDTGAGIEEEHLERIFERFYRTDRSRDRAAGGNGLGLSIVKHLTQALGGKILVESRVGQGSTFTVHLPVREGREAPPLSAGSLAQVRERELPVERAIQARPGEQLEV